MFLLIAHFYFFSKYLRDFNPCSLFPPSALSIKVKSPQDITPYDDL